MVPAWSARLIASLALALLYQQVPTFRTSTDVVVVDVQVTARDGSPIGDLSATEFTLKIDGRPRAIQSVILDRIDETKPARRIRGGVLPPPVPFEAQSYVMIIADPWLMRAEASRNLFDQAARFVDELPDAHAVAFQKLPARQVQFPYSTDRRPISAALREQVGGLNSNAELLPSEGSNTLDSIQAAIDTMSRLDGRRTIVLLIDALPDPQDRLRALGQRAADANITIHTIATKPPAMVDITARRPTDPTKATQSIGGAAVLSDATGGFTIMRATNDSLVMPKIAAWLSQQYLLTFAIELSDRNGKAHTIDVEVNRRDLDVRARRSFIR